jgi:hypothetical protein
METIVLAFVIYIVRMFFFFPDQRFDGLENFTAIVFGSAILGEILQRILWSF